jgi:hypothetical protein
MKNINTGAIIRKHYPKTSDCSGGHIGETILTFFEEPADDRTYLLIVPRCSHCKIPNGADQYADEINQERYYAGLDPIKED